MNVTEKNRDKIFINLYGYKQNEDREPSLVDLKLKPGDFVRLSKNKNLFEKGSTNNWTKEIFIVDKIIFKDEPVYIIKDQNEEIIQGLFYEKELQKVYKNS